MEEIIALLQTNPTEALKKLYADNIDPKEISDLRKEYHELERTKRDTQVGNVQKDKTIGTGEKQRLVKSIRIPVPFQKKIVTTSTAFEFGEPATIIPSKDTDLAQEIIRLWRENRIDSKLLEAKKLQKSELQSALLFVIKDLKPENLLNKIFGINTNKEISVRLLKNKNGIMTPYYDASGDMTAFIWEFSTILNDKEIKNIWVYTADKVYQISNESGSLKLDNAPAHGFGKIPIVYLSQEKPEWFDVQDLIDRLEVSLSKHGNSNDYAGHPILKIYGEVAGAPDKNDDGKAFILAQKETHDGKIISSDVDFLTYENAPESVKLEQQNLISFIYSLTSTPNLSFEALKGLGNGLSGKVLKMLLIDPILKAKMNEGENRTILQRIINVFISGTITTTGKKLKKDVSETYFDIIFNSIIPDDMSDIVEFVTKLKEKQLISSKTAIETVGLVENAQEELDAINAEKTKPKADGFKEEETLV
ncbi:phage portal protein [uncultured Wocania sp.]|uniref:phage portal protein n=1 Tax=uncultured Wocania sp. TaxID=2834404 RepID=UPI0030F6EE2D